MQKHAADVDKHRDPTLGLPPVIERIVLWQDFWTMHLPSFRRAIYSAQRAFIGGPPLDRTTEMVTFVFTYRHDSGGNPAKAFKLVDAVIGKVSRVTNTPGALKMWEQGREDREEDAAAYRASGVVCQGFIPIRCTIDNNAYTYWTYNAVVSLTPEHQALIDIECNHEGPLELLEMWVGLGWVLTLDHPGVDTAKSLGEMIKKGKQWKWRAFSPEKLMEIGLPPGYRMLG